jgi:hypothetical protein
MIISHDLLERTCKSMIETILLCLEHATRGTIYRVGLMPRLQAMRVTSGERENGNGLINWGLPEASDYNYPGKSWEQYRDRPGHVLEAMGWCVEKQKSWTADDPYEDIRSVRKQLRGEIEDFHHMEPVLVRKKDFGEHLLGDMKYPVDWQGNAIWQGTDYIVVAVIKIHFLPYTIQRGDRSTKIIKKLSRTLGTELLSLSLRETLSNAQKELTHQRLQTCNALAHDMRNTLAKLSFIFSAINAEISFLREQWELQLRQACPAMEDKQAILGRLNQLLRQGLPQLNGAGELAGIGQELLIQQEKFAGLSLLPQHGESWIRNRIRHRWMRLLMKSSVWEEAKDEIQQLLDRLERLMWIGLDSSLASQIQSLPEDLKAAWMRIAYTSFTAERLDLLQEMLDFLEHPALSIPHKQQTKKILTSLKALVDIIPEMEERANRMIFSLRDGCSISAVEGTPAEGCEPTAGLF